MEDKIVAVGNRIKILRMRNNISQTQLAEKIDLSQTNMSNIEHGRTAATLVNLFKIREILNCKMSDFFVDIDGEDNSKKEFSLGELQEAVKVLQMLREGK